MNLLVPIVHGSEIRQFVFSGYTKQANLKGFHVILTYPREIPSIEKEIRKYDKTIRILKNPASYNLASRTKFSYLKHILDLNFKTSALFGRENSISAGICKEIILRLLLSVMKLELIVNFLIYLERIFASRIHSEEWKIFLVENQIDEIIINSPNIALALNLTAQRLKIPINLYFHTSKDVFKNRMIFKIKSFGVWDSQMTINLKKLFLNLDENTIFEVCGNLHLLPFLNMENIYRREEFEDIFACSTSELLILYTTAAPWLITNEEEYLFDIENSLKRQNISKYKIILRVNPMDNSNKWENYSSDNVCISRPKWYWNENYNMNFTLFDDLRIYASLLHYSSVCVSLPSSITIEASLLSTPVLNINYVNVNAGLSNNSIFNLWNSLFYRDIRNKHKVFPINDSRNWDVILDIYS